MKVPVTPNPFQFRYNATPPIVISLGSFSQNTGVPWLSCRNGMRDPIVVGLHVWCGEDSRGVETGEL